MSEVDYQSEEARFASADESGADVFEETSSSRPLSSDGRQAEPLDDGPASPAKPARRKKILALLAVLVVATTVGIPYYLYARVHVSTDDAFIEGHIVPISPRVSGHVAKVYVTDNQWVNKGDLLVEIDPRDFEASLAAAKAGLEGAKAVADSRKIGVDVTEITSSAGVDDSKAALDAAKAAVETARAAVTTATSQRSQAEAQLAATQASLKQAQAAVEAADARHDRASTHLARMEKLLPQKAVSEESLDEATAGQRVAEADAAAARQQVHAQESAVQQATAALAASESSLLQATAGVTAALADQARAEAKLAAANAAPSQVAQSQSQQSVAEAEVDRAEAGLTQAELNLSYTKIYAPVSGHVTRKSIEPGAFVQVGQALMAVVEPEVWVIANFKETQLTEMRPGQPVSVEVDTYPGVEFAARVESIQRGAGARFSLLPPENATGNYVKVVQRVPVKIVFDDPAQLDRYVVGPGMSVVPTVDLRPPQTDAVATAQSRNSDVR